MSQQVDIVQNSRTVTAGEVTAKLATVRLLPPGTGFWMCEAAHGRNATSLKNEIYFLLERVSDGKFATLNGGIQATQQESIYLIGEIPVAQGFALLLHYNDVTTSDAIHWSVTWRKIL